MNSDGAVPVPADHVPQPERAAHGRLFGRLHRNRTREQRLPGQVVRQQRRPGEKKIYKQKIQSNSVHFSALHLVEYLAFVYVNTDSCW